MCSLLIFRSFNCHLLYSKFLTKQKENVDSFRISSLFNFLTYIYTFINIFIESYCDKKCGIFVVIRVRLLSIPNNRKGITQCI